MSETLNPATPDQHEENAESNTTVPATETKQPASENVSEETAPVTAQANENVEQPNEPNAAPETNTAAPVSENVPEETAPATEPADENAEQPAAQETRPENNAANETAPATEAAANETLLSNDEQDETELSEDEKEIDVIDELPDFSSYSKEQLVQTAVDAVRDKDATEATRILKAVRPVLNALLQSEYDAAQQKFIEEGGLKDDFRYQDKDNAREHFNNASKELKQKKADERTRQEKERLDNLKKKEAILEQIKQLGETEENKDSLKKLKELQQEWKLIRNIPKNDIDRLWELYKIYLDRFYDRLSIFNELKDLDRKKNLDQKIELTKKVAELALDPSAKHALILLKKFQEDWRNIGPVPQESNEDIWNRFKQECDKIYEMIKAVMDENQRKREENLEAKKSLLVKALELSNIHTTKIKEWLEHSTAANQLMEDWKKVGMVPLKFRESIWEEFRNARNQFFTNKNNFFKKLHSERNANLKLKTELCQRAENIAMAPIDWNKQTADLKKLQEEWKKAGPVHDKVSDDIWKRFRAACDLFFEKKAEHYASQIGEQKQNLETKRGLIQKLEALLGREDSAEIIGDIKAIQQEWNSTGFVPMGEKEGINKKYSELSDTVFNKFRQANKELRDMKDRNHMESLATAPNGLQKLKREERMIIERIRGLQSDIVTWDNNLGFFKNGENPLAQQIREKIAIAEKHIGGLEEKLKGIRTFIKQQQPQQ